MTAEEQALKAYPVKEEWMGNQWDGILVDVNATIRDGFIEGYKQAEQDLIEKAKQWFTDNIPSKKVQLLWCDFEKFIAD